MISLDWVTIGRREVDGGGVYGAKEAGGSAVVVGKGSSILAGLGSRASELSGAPRVKVGFEHYEDGAILLNKAQLLIGHLMTRENTNRESRKLSTCFSSLLHYRKTCL